jgi:hypothetical protein
MPKDYIPNDPSRPGLGDDDLNRGSGFNDPLRFDPDTAGTTTGNGAKIGLVAVALVLLMGAVFYGVSHSNVNEAGNTPSTQTAQTQPGAPAAPPGMRDVTPRAPNTDPGTTTGAAPKQPAPPQTAPNK